MKDTKPIRCAACDRDIIVGEDVIAHRVGVIGPRGFVPLEDTMYFCNEDCELQHCQDVTGDRRSLPRRIP